MAATKLAARQAGSSDALAPPPAPDIFFFHPSKGLIDDPFSSGQGAVPAPATTQLAPAPALAPAPRFAPTPTPIVPATAQAPHQPGYPVWQQYVQQEGYAQQGYAQQGYTQQGFAQHRYAQQGFLGAQQVAQGGYAQQLVYGGYAAQPAYGGQPHKPHGHPQQYPRNW